MTRPLRHAIPLLVLLLCLAPLQPSLADDGPVLAHLCVIPSPTPQSDADGKRQEAFETWLCRRFGGFTRLGRGRGGWIEEAGRQETETNAVYLVTTTGDTSRELAERIARDFAVRVPYVLVFPATRFPGGAQ